MEKNSETKRNFIFSKWRIFDYVEYCELNEYSDLSVEGIYIVDTIFVVLNLFTYFLIL